MMTSRNQHVPLMPQATEFQEWSKWWMYSGWGLLALWTILVNSAHLIYSWIDPITIQISWNQVYKFWLRSSVIGMTAFGAIYFLWGLAYCLFKRCSIDVSVKQMLIIVIATIPFAWIGSILLFRSEPVAEFTAADLAVALFDLLQMNFLLLLMMGNSVILIGLIVRVVELVRGKNV